MNPWLSVSGEAGIKAFICYRRAQDDLGIVLLRDRIVQHFGVDSVFVDVHGIPPGKDFRTVLTESVSACDVLLVIITDKWLSLQHEDGRRRLDMEDDFVRIEIETALAREIQIIPVLLGKATLPAARALPESIRALAYRQAVSVRGGLDCDRDLDRLTDALKQIAASLDSVRKEWNLLIDSVERGDWLLAGQMRGSAAVKKELQATAQYRALEALRAQVEHLRDGAAALELSDLPTAHSAFAGVAAGAPPIVAASKAFVALGARLCEAALDLAALHEADREFRQIALQSPQGAKVPGERQVNELLQRLLRDAEYQDAARQYEEGDFESAARRFDLLDYRDAKERLARCTEWMAIVREIREQKWDGARKQLRAFAARWDEPRARHALKWCASASSIVPALQQLAAGEDIADERVLWDGGPSPYKVLHLSPAATPREYDDRSYALQEQPGGMTLLQRASWDALRLIDRRLIADFSLYSVRDPESAHEALERHFRFDAQATPAEVLARIRNAAGAVVVKSVVAELGDGRGVLHALTRNYDEAIDAFSELARHTPWDSRALHHLGLAAYTKAHLARENDDTGDTWETVAMAWGAVFADTRFWRWWWAQRRRNYPVPDEEQVSAARTKLRAFLVEELKSATDRDFALADVFRIELNAARAVDALGGIPVGSGPQRRVVSGPRGIAALGLESALASWIATFPLDVLSGETPQRNVCVAFSTIAPAQLLFEEGWYEDAIALLEADDSGESFATRNPGFASIRAGRGPTLFQSVRRALLRQARMKAALAAVSEVPVNLEDAVTHWNRALTLTEGARDAERLRSEIRDVVVGRCQVLQNQESEGRPRLESLNDAVKLAQEATQNWDNAEGALRQTLAEALLDRATHLSNEFDMEKEARDDALRACGLAPESLHAVLVLCATSLHYAKELHRHGKPDLAEALVREVTERLAEAERLFPGNSDLQATSRVAQETAALLAGGAASLERALESLGKVAAESRTAHADTRLAQAMVLEAQSDFPRAIELYWQLAQAAPPGEGESIGRLSWCYRMWLLHLRDSGDADGYQRVARDASARCPNAAALSDFFDVLPGQEREAT